jgi:dCMP deaminase
MTWDRYFLNMLEGVAARSKDAHTKVGVIIVGPDQEIRSTGYNSFPRGINDNLPERQERPAKYLFFEHGERNAIYNAARVGIPLKGCKLYVCFYPCADCARAIIQSGIVEVIFDGADFEAKEKAWNERWKEQMDATKQMFAEANVTVRIYTGA